MNIKTPEEIAIMAEGGKKLGTILDHLLGMVKVGAIPLDIDAKAQELISNASGTPSFFTVNDYKWATCISVNEGVVHGIPTKTPFKPGDIVSIDVGLLYKGFHTDTSWTVYVPLEKPDSTEKETLVFLETGKLALSKAIGQAQVGKHIGDISAAMGSTVEGAGYHVIRSLVGHGVGRKLHEAPQVPGLLTRPVGKTPKLLPGMVLALEVIYSVGSSEIVYSNDDGWSLSTADGSLAALYEQTVAISEDGAIVLTQIKN